MRGPSFSQSDLVVEAAAAGYGVALARYSIAAADLRAGRLVNPLGVEWPSDAAYYLCSLVGEWSRPDGAPFAPLAGRRGEKIRPARIAAVAGRFAVTLRAFAPAAMIWAIFEIVFPVAALAAAGFFYAGFRAADVGAVNELNLNIFFAGADFSRVGARGVGDGRIGRLRAGGGGDCFGIGAGRVSAASLVALAAARPSRLR